ncbi:MAG: hypothetical protein AAF671_05635 [Pseudomonadota bacterium]
MATEIREQIEHARINGNRLIGLIGDPFIESTILRGKPVPWTRPTEYVAHHSQMLSLLKPDLAVFDVQTFYRHWLEENFGVLSEMRGKRRIRFALKKLLSMDEPRALLRDLASALLNSVSQPLVLLLPENNEFVNWANMRANGGELREVTDLDTDTVSVYFADFLRTFSGLDLAGVILQLPQGSEIGSNLKELYSPVLNVCRLYQWSAGALAMTPSLLGDADLPLDFWISDHPRAPGYVLDESAWSSEQVKSSATLLFSCVPSGIDPGEAIDQISRWRSEAAA